MSAQLALHTWTLDSTPLADALRIVREAGWNAVELRRLDFNRALESGKSADDVISLVKASGLPVACVGVELGWMWAEGAERRRLLEVFAEQCARAAVLGCTTVMSPVDRGEGSIAQAAASLREVGDLAAAARVRLALEFNSQAAQVNTLGRVREILARAGHPACGLLLDTYHLHRSGATVRDIDDVAPGEIAYVQYSDVPAGAVPGQAMPRLAPGLGVVPFREWFRAFAGKGYMGYMSYEAPDPAAWARPAAEVARAALAATRAVL
jgi:sugar phosphate isomerase/epimerase